MPSPNDALVIRGPAIRGCLERLLPTIYASKCHPSSASGPAIWWTSLAQVAGVHSCCTASFRSGVVTRSQPQDPLRAPFFDFPFFQQPDLTPHGSCVCAGTGFEQEQQLRAQITDLQKQLEARAQTGAQSEYRDVTDLFTDRPQRLSSARVRKKASACGERPPPPLSEIESTHCMQTGISAGQYLMQKDVHLRTALLSEVCVHGSPGVPLAPQPQIEGGFWGAPSTPSQRNRAHMSKLLHTGRPVKCPTESSKCLVAMLAQRGRSCSFLIFSDAWPKRPHGAPPASRCPSSPLIPFQGLLLCPSPLIHPPHPPMSPFLPFQEVRRDSL